MKLFHVYIMASRRRALYIGITSALYIRVKQHKRDAHPESFSARYHCHNLVYYETFSDPHSAIRRETELKGWLRAKKIALVEGVNPKWSDLAADWGRKMSQEEMRKHTIRNLPASVFAADSSSGFRPPQNDTLVMGGRGGENAELFVLEREGSHTLLRLTSHDNTNRLTRDRVIALTEAIERLADEPTPQPLILAGNEHFFSAGADLNEIRALTGPQAFVFAEMGQRLMRATADFPAPCIAAIEGYCMGGGLDLALTCHSRIASPHAIFGHRGAALGLMTGWGGTQRLPGLIGKGRAMQMFLAAERLHASEAQRTGLVHFLADDPVTYVTDVLVPSLR